MRNKQRSMRMIISRIFILCLFLAFASCQKANSPASPYELKCEFRENPAGIDRQEPLLQWKMKDDRRGAMKKAYRIMVASSPGLLENNKADIWDSGKTESEQSVHIKYAGEELSSGKSYFWKVRLWDKDGKATGWSKPAFWEMGRRFASNPWQNYSEGRRLEGEGWCHRGNFVDRIQKNSC